MIAIISDIHANNVALTAVLENIDSKGIKEIVCLGDIAGYHCEINECCDVLRSRKIFSLMGNHDSYLVKDEQCLRSRSVNRCIEYQRSIITKENLAWLESLQPSSELNGLNMVHGGWRDELEEYVVPSFEYFANLPGKVFVSGHTHVPVIWSLGGLAYCNPGSVGQPRDGDAGASYATWDGTCFELHRVEYDVREIQKKMSDAGFEPYFYEGLSRGARLGGKIDRLDLKLDK
jgi:predicted phosphodiesterase